MFRSPREALSTMLKKHDGRGHRAQTYTDRVDSSYVEDEVAVRIAAMVYGEGKGCRGVARAPMDWPRHVVVLPYLLEEWEVDLTLQTWCFNRCYLCGGNTLYGDNHRCERGPEAGREFWVPRRRRHVENMKKWLRKRLRDEGLMRPPVRMPKTKRRPVIPGDDVVLAFDESHEPVHEHHLTPPATLQIDEVDPPS